MAVVRVWNRNQYTLKEMFKGEPIEIKPGDYIELEKEDAYLLKGQYVPRIFDAGGQQDPRSFKMLHIEEISKDTPTKVNPHACMSCKYQAGSPKELELHLNSQHADAARLELEMPAPTTQATQKQDEAPTAKRSKKVS